MQDKKKEAKVKVEDLEKGLREIFASVFDKEAEDPDTIVKHVGQYNLKKLAEEFGALSLSGQRQTDLWFNRIFANTTDHIERLRAYEESMIKDMVTHSKNVDARTLLHVPTHDFAFSRIWTFIDELAASLSAKTGLQQDVVVDLLIKFLSEALAPKVAEASKSK